MNNSIISYIYIYIYRYTQNIDGLERAAGVRSELLVETNGGFSSCHCINKTNPHSYPVDMFRSALHASTTAPEVSLSPSLSLDS